MALQNGLLFYKLDSNSPDFLEKLDARITDKINAVKEFAASPIRFDSKHNAWFIHADYLNYGQDGGYDSLEQATIALAIIKIKPEMDYQKLYAMSNFITKGLM